MAVIVGVHGIAQQLKEAPVLDQEWWTPLKGGIHAAKRTIPPDGSFTSAFYGKLFRPPGQVRAAGDREFVPDDVTDEFEKALLGEWWVGAAAAEPRRVVSPEAKDLRLAVPRSVQSALQALSRSKFFVGVAQSAMIGNLKQVRDYMKVPLIRDLAQQAVNDVVTADTRVIVAHSLGTVVTYEALHRYADAPNWANVRTLVTLGSPLGIPNLIFDALVPSPEQGAGKWPARIERWTNLSADNDVVALEKRLAPLFGKRLVDMQVENEAKAHDVSPYLTADVTGAAISDGLEA
jgi:hypothetical protein